MNGLVTVSTSTGLSPEWDRWFDEAFTDLITGDEELLRAEFDDLIASGWESPPPASPAASAGGEAAAENSRGDRCGNAEQPEPDPGRASRPPPPETA